MRFTSAHPFIADLRMRTPYTRAPYTRAMQDAVFTRERLLKNLVFNLVLSATIIFGGMTVLWYMPGPEATAFVIMLAYVAVVGIAGYFVAQRWMPEAFQGAPITPERLLKTLALCLVLSALFAAGGATVLRYTPGPEAGAIAATLAYAAVFAIPAYFVARRWMPQQER